MNSIKLSPKVFNPEEMLSPGIKYPYSLRFGLGALLLASILMFLAIRNLMTLELRPFVMTIIILLVIGYSFFVIWLMLKRIRPALQRRTALQLDPAGINDYVYNIQIAWKDVREIQLIPGRTALALRFILPDNKDNTSDRVINISLRWVRGKEDEIFESALAYFRQATR